MASAAARVARQAFTSRLYITVLVAIALGTAVGLAFPKTGESLQPLGDTFIAMIRMLIGPVVFCTIVTGIASAGHLTSVGRIGIKALVYFEVVTTLALIVGLVAMDLVGPGRGIHAHPSDLHLTGSAKGYVSAAGNEHWYDFLVNIVPKTVVSAFVEGNVLQVLFVAVLFAIAVKLLGERGAPIIGAVERVGEVFFGIVKMVMYFSPIGAFGAMAYAVGKFGGRTLSSLGAFIGLFWAVGILFMLIVFGAVARLCGLRILKLYAYFKDELLITLGTANYEAVMPRLIEKLERLGCPKPIVSLVVPSGYAFNGDGVCLYLGFASLFIAQAFGVDLSLWQQIGLLAVFLITSKGSAGVAGSGFIILAATLSTTGAVPVVGIMLILGIDRFLSTMRGLVSLGGQILGSLVVSRWEGVLDVPHARAELNGEATVALPEKAPVGAAA
ncbi:cation:dicarboxylate symporter family transporter [Planosporangium mesophilum]|uniref:C4-dicarboxylate transport protein 2 n=1 Tax=Planosporangium mesophilum TaxID=689768 RepID=A0A8J3T976_9ACTN|nr:cation:dicarboxylase symporter family transporter [Planosporangium mesophilum]NJC84127.1 cation:dicarboxylase symporter family transporter [Planosporangium mesophilum]GII22870.1 C4-dicarboxylate transport protein 2 [Planosporangium mesophilum]